MERQTDGKTFGGTLTVAPVGTCAAHVTVHLPGKPAALVSLGPEMCLEVADLLCHCAGLSDLGDLIRAFHTEDLADQVTDNG